MQLFTRKKISTRDLLLAALIVVGSLWVFYFAEREDRPPYPVPYTEKTPDRKYKLYDLRGELEDVNYISGDNTVYTPDDLVKYIPFISPEDVNNGEYVCEFVCKNIDGKIVGLNPAWSKLYDKQVTN